MCRALELLLVCWFDFLNICHTKSMPSFFSDMSRKSLWWLFSDAKRAFQKPELWSQKIETRRSGHNLRSVFTKPLGGGLPTCSSLMPIPSLFGPYHEALDQHLWKTWKEIKSYKDLKHVQLDKNSENLTCMQVSNALISFWRAFAASSLGDLLVLGFLGCLVFPADCLSSATCESSISPKAALAVPVQTAVADVLLPALVTSPPVRSCPIEIADWILGFTIKSWLE